MNIRFKQTVVAVAAVFFIVLIIVPTDTMSQGKKGEQTDSEDMVNMMGPMMGNMMQVMMETMLATIAKPKTAERLATFTKNYYDALIARGFSKEQAMKIVMSVGIPSIPMMK